MTWQLCVASHHNDAGTSRTVINGNLTILMMAMMMVEIQTILGLADVHCSSFELKLIPNWAGNLIVCFNSLNITFQELYYFGHCVEMILVIVALSIIWHLITVSLTRVPTS